uniref:Uncharacterized protein n=1 Tax=Alexandrium catenella TaxID=2925 RepID=A0A7S1LNQ8_ALECA|mmetsp:Transcript_117137/g.311519  ORF Transcript_117137/g.311519 Transcript_117137/m.311519 type:complete len:452 (+) Transcript_117137:103-1458(+)
MPRLLLLVLLSQWLLCATLRRRTNGSFDEDPDNVAWPRPPCADITETLLYYRCHDSDMGNSLVTYWNARAVAFFAGLEFIAAEGTEHLLLPAQVPAHQKSPSAMQQRLWQKMTTELDDVCIGCPYPHGSPYGPWRLIGDTILAETRGMAEATRGISDDVAKFLDWSQRKSWVVIHHRCDKYLWINEQYGFLRHSYIKDRLPKNTTHMLIVGQEKHSDVLCQKFLDELLAWAREDMKISTSFQQEDAAVDWVTLSTAPVLFCSTSTFCLTAGMGNPNTVYFPVNGENTVVMEDGPEIKEASKLRSPGFHWVQHDYIPGPVALHQKWEAIRAYLHADTCNETLHPCVAVGGLVPLDFFVVDPPDAFPCMYRMIDVEKRSSSRRRSTAVRCSQAIASGRTWCSPGERALNFALPERFTDCPFDKPGSAKSGASRLASFAAAQAVLTALLASMLF